MSPKTDLSLKDNLPFPQLRFLQFAACTVIVLWGVRAFSEILGPLILGIGLAYTVAPFPKWLMRRFKLSKSLATAVTAVMLAVAGLLTVLTVNLGVARMAARLPVYEERLTALNEQTLVFLNANGVDTASFSFEKLLTAERLSETAVWIVPEAGAMIGKGLFVLLLGLLFVIEMLPDAVVKPGPIAKVLALHVSHTKAYLVVNAKTGGINALVNLAFLLAMGVDGAVVWCFLYFFLNFIPTLGFSIALLPPTFLTLLTQGWSRALLVAGGLILTNLIVDNIVTPMFAKRAMSISFLELTLSLVGWGFLLGLPGAIAAVPLTLAAKDLFAKKLGQDWPAPE